MFRAFYIAVLYLSVIFSGALHQHTDSVAHDNCAICAVYDTPSLSPDTTPPSVVYITTPKDSYSDNSVYAPECKTLSDILSQSQPKRGPPAPVVI